MLCLAVALAAPAPVTLAATITVPISAIAAQQPGLPAQPGETRETFIARQLAEQFARLGLEPRSGLVFGAIPIEAETQKLASVCPVPLPKAVHTDATSVGVKLMDGSLIEFDLDSLRAMRVRFLLVGELHALTSAWVQWGQAIPFVGNCEKIGTDNGKVTVHLPFTLEFAVDVSLIPQFDDAAVALIVDKLAAASGRLDFGSGWIDPDFGSVSLTGAIISALENYLLGKMRDRGAESFRDNLRKLNNRFAGLDGQGNPDPALDPFNGPTQFPLLKAGDDSATARALIQELDLGRLLVAALDKRGTEILLELALLDEVRRKEFLAELASSFLCDVVLNRYEVTAAVNTPMYALESGNCVATNLYGADRGAYFTDSVCTQAVAFQPTPRAKFCAATFGQRARSLLGNAAAWTPDPAQANDPLPGVPSRPWTLWPSTRLDIGVVGSDSLRQPYMKQIAYREVPSERGTGICTLEMRVYKQDVGAAGLRPLLALHGGTWESRGFSFLGLEASVAQFTQRGFVVFAPFYRLVGDDDANAECNAVTWREVTADVEAALSWVEKYGAAFGSAQQAVTVFGQSAGAHLAAWLAVRQPVRVARGLLLYPPTDVLAFLGGAVPPGGPFQSFRDFGLKALAQFYGAAEGPREVQLDQIPFAEIDVSTLAARAQALIPERVFQLANVDIAAPPRYLRRCADLTGVDLTLLSGGSIPPPLLACLKDDLAEFLLANSFYHQVNSATADMFVVHGGADTLVPAAQTIALCSALGGQPPADPLSVDHNAIDCGPGSAAHLIAGAQHALDLALCAGALCPAGQPGGLTRAAVRASLLAGLDWIEQPAGLIAGAPALGPGSVAARPPRRANSGSGGGGSGAISELLLLLSLAARRLRRHLCLKQA